MQSEGDDVAALQALRSGVARQFAERLRTPATPLPELRDLQERLRLLDAAIASPERTERRRRRAALAAAAAVAAALSLGALIPMPSVPFTLEAEASAVRLRSNGAGELGPQAVAGELLVEGYTALESPDAALMQQAGARGGGRMTVGAPSLSVRRVSYPAGSTVDVVAGAQAASLTIHAPQGRIGVAVEISGRAATRFGAGGPPRVADYPYAEWIRLTSGDGAAGRVPPPVTLSLGRAADTEYAWSNLRPAEVRFVERGLAADNQPIVASSLQKAHVKLQASASDVELGAGDELELGGLEVQRCDLVLGSGVRLKLSGTARTLLTRTGHFERSLKPSLLEYAARHQTVGLLWSAALLLWGTARWLQRAVAAEV